MATVPVMPLRDDELDTVNGAGPGTFDAIFEVVPVARVAFVESLL